MLSSAFDGTNDYLTRGAGLTGQADSKLVTACIVLAKAGSDGVQERILSGSTALGGGTRAFTVTKLSTNRLAVRGGDGVGADILSIDSAADSMQVADGQQVFTFSCDMADVAKRHLYIGNTSDLSVNIYTNAVIPFTANLDWAVGAQADASGKLQADVARIMMWIGQYTDLSVEANRRMFVDASARPANPIAAIAALGAPIVWFEGKPSKFTNRGTGGTFTLTGTLTDGAVFSTPSRMPRTFPARSFRRSF